jgi:hypothetical protein
MSERLKNLNKLEQNLLKNIKEDKEIKKRIEERRKRIDERLRQRALRSPSPTSITEDFEKPKKTYKEKSLMKAKSELKKKGDSYTVDTEMNVRKGLDAKVKRALKKSVVEELDKKISGSGIRKIDLDMSSDEEEMKGKGGCYSKNKVYNTNTLTNYEIDKRIDNLNSVLKNLRGSLEGNRDNHYTPGIEENIRDYENQIRRLQAMKSDIGMVGTTKSNIGKNKVVPIDDYCGIVPEGSGIKRRGRPKKKVEESSSESEEEEPKRRGRPKKGKGIEYDSSSDEDEIKTYGQMLKHLVSHIKDPKEPIDPKDYKQAIQLIKRIKSKKA